MALRAFDADLFDDRLRMAAFGKIGAGDKLAEAAHFVHHRAAAYVAVDPGRLVFNLHFAHFFFRHFQPFLELAVKLIDDFDPFHFSLFNSIQLFFHFRRKLDIDDFREKL